MNTYKNVLTILAFLLYILHTYGGTVFWHILYKVEYVDEVGSSSLVKDIRGEGTKPINLFHTIRA